MRQQTTYDRKELIERKEQLETIRNRLKKEFIGIDQVVDEVIDTISAWYLLPGLQERPLIVNLWGLTGTGKTSMVERLVELLEMRDKFYRLDMGDPERSWQVQDQLREIHNYYNGAPIILTMDEFQHLRTIGEDTKELRRPRSRVIWQLLDDGSIQLTDLTRSFYELSWLIPKAQWFLKNGVVVEKGLVVGNREFFLEHSNRLQVEDWEDTEKRQNASIPFIHKKFYDNIFELDRQNYHSEYEVEDKLMTMNGHEIIAYLTRLYEVAMVPKRLDCSKALIFVIGNLDEAYKVSHNLDPDISADEFHEFCKRINVPEVKKALQERFRNEEIARLGNNHVIYPAFDSATYRAIIRQAVDTWCRKIESEYKLEIRIDQTVYDLIYREGVYPTQGTRPVYTTIHQIVQSNAGAILSHYWMKGIDAEYVLIRFARGEIIAEFQHEDKVVETISFPQKMKLDNLRESKRDDHQAIVAVHESGHAICSVLLRGIAPETVISSTANTDSEGFTFTRSNLKFTSRKDIIRKLAVYLGGHVAETVVFGNEHVTTGAQGDIHNATRFIARMLKECGMGEVPGFYSVSSPETNLSLFDTDHRLDDEISRYLKAGMELARTTLEREEQLLLKMADHLSDHRVVQKEEVVNLCERYGTSFSRTDLVEDEARQFYREFLKRKVAGLNTAGTQEKSHRDVVVLNKDAQKEFRE